MKFCPICGSVRDGKDKCDCGYNYITGEVEKKLFSGMTEALEIQMNKGAISLDELKSRKLDMGDLLSVSYTTSGGMMGQYYYTGLSFTKNEINTINQEWHHGDRIERIYKVDSDKVSEIKKIIIDNNFRAWSEVPVDRSMIAFDAPNSRMGLVFEKGSVSISTDIYMSKEENDIYINLRNMIFSLCNDETKISEKVLEQGQAMGLFMYQNNTSDNSKKRFCPECGKVFEDEIYECTCGYVVPEENRK